MLIVGRRSSPGGTFYTGDALAKFQPIPNFHLTRAVVQFDEPVAGMWPGIWKRPLSGEGEIDDWEKFGTHVGEPGEDHGTLHTTPYDGGHHRMVGSRDFPRLGTGRHVIQTENAPSGFTWWVDGRKVETVTPQEYDDKTGSRDWATMFGDPAKRWYLRVTLQAGGPGGGPIPDDLLEWRFWVHRLEVFAPIPSASRTP